MPTDHRPALSQKLKELDVQEVVWWTWPYPRVRLKLARPLSDPPQPSGWVVFVHRSRFGVGLYADKDGETVQCCRWVDGRPGPECVYVHDIRAVVVESHPPL